MRQHAAKLLKLGRLQSRSHQGPAVRSELRPHMLILCYILRVHARQRAPLAALSEVLLVQLLHPRLPSHHLYGRCRLTLVTSWQHVQYLLSYWLLCATK